MKDVKYVDIILENCESIRLGRHCIGRFWITGIKSDISRIASNCISKCTYADEIAMEILKIAKDEEYYPFGQKDFNDTNKIDRLYKHNDITGISITYIDKTEETIYVDYDEGEHEGMLGAPNVNQKTYLSNVGNLYVVISREKGIEDYFDMENINDNENIKPTEGAMVEFNINSLPDMYKYVYLHKGEVCDNDYEVGLAVRVFDKVNGWKFVFEKETVSNPTEWEYPYESLYKFIEDEKKETDFSIEALLEKYPVPDSIDAEESSEIYKIWEEAKSAVEAHNKKSKNASETAEEKVSNIINNAKKTFEKSIQETADIASRAAEKAEKLTTKGIDRIKKYLDDSNIDVDKYKKKTSDVMKQITDKVDKFKQDIETIKKQEEEKLKSGSQNKEDQSDDEEFWKHNIFPPVSENELEDMLEALRANDEEIKKEEERSKKGSQNKKEKLDDEEILKHMDFSPVSKNEIENLLSALSAYEEEDIEEEEKEREEKKDKGKSKANEKVNIYSLLKVIDKAGAILDKAVDEANDFIKKVTEQGNTSENNASEGVKIDIEGEDD